MEKIVQTAQREYTLVAGSMWIVVDSLVVKVTRTDEGVVCDVYPNGQEDNDHLLTATYAFFAEADNADELA